MASSVRQGCHGVRDVTFQSDRHSRRGSERYHHVLQCLRRILLLTPLLGTVPGCDARQDGEPSTARTAQPVEVRPLAVLDTALMDRGLTVEYRWEARDTTAAQQSLPVFSHPTNIEHLLLSDSIAFDLSGAVAVRVRLDGEAAFVVLELSEAGMERLVQTTASHAGERIGVLVNGRLVTVAGVQSAMWNMLPVVTGVPLEQAEALAGRINAVLGTD